MPSLYFLENECLFWENFSLISSSFVYSAGYALDDLECTHMFQIEAYPKQQLCLFATMAYIYGETHGSVPKPRFVSVFEGSESRLSIPFRFVRNGRNISYQFKKQNKFHLILNLGPFRIFRLNSTRNISLSFHMFRSAIEKLLNLIEPCSI